MAASDKWTHHDIPDQSGKTVIITGANSGIGYEAAKALAAKGARLVLACRDMAKCPQAAKSITHDHPNAQVHPMHLDLAELESIYRFAEAFRKNNKELHILINNAGVMMPPYSKTRDGFELQFGVNHLGHFALSGLLIDLLANTKGQTRVVTVSSAAHKVGDPDFGDLNWEKRKYKKFQAYGDSKLANLYFAFELQRKLHAAGANSISVACHPGWTATRLQRYVPMMTLINPLFGQKSLHGAWTTEYAAAAEGLEGGEFIGPDGWMQIGGHPIKVKARATAYDKDMAARLWKESETLTGVKWSL